MSTYICTCSVIKDTKSIHGLQCLQSFVLDAIVQHEQGKTSNMKYACKWPNNASLESFSILSDIVHLWMAWLKPKYMLLLCVDPMKYMDSNTSFSIIRQNGVQITTFVAKKTHCHHWWIWNACPRLMLSMCTLSWIDPTRGLSSTLRFTYTTCKHL